MWVDLTPGWTARQKLRFPGKKEFCIKTEVSHPAWVSSLAACPNDFRHASPHSHGNQFLKINTFIHVCVDIHTYAYLHTYACVYACVCVYECIYWFCFPREPWVMQRERVSKGKKKTYLHKWFPFCSSFSNLVILLNFGGIWVVCAKCMDESENLQGDAGWSV